MKLILPLLNLKPQDRWWYWKPDCNLFWENEYTVVLLFSLDEVWACPQCDVTSSYLPFWWWWWTQSCFSTLRLKNWSNGLYTTSFCTTFTAPTFLLTLRCPLIFLFYKMPLLCHFWFILVKFKRLGKVRYFSWVHLTTINGLWSEGIPDEQTSWWKKSLNWNVDMGEKLHTCRNIIMDFLCSSK